MLLPYHFNTDDTEDRTPPVVSYCPDDINLTAPFALASSMAISWFPEPIAFDNSGLVPVLTQTHATGDLFEIGTTQVMYTFVGGSGKVATCTFLVRSKIYCSIK